MIKFTVTSQDGIEQYESLDAIERDIEGIDFLESSARVFDDEGNEYIPEWIERPIKSRFFVTVGKYVLRKASEPQDTVGEKRLNSDAQQGTQPDAFDAG